MTSISGGGSPLPPLPENDDAVDEAGSDIPGPAGSLAWTITTQEVLGMVGRKWVIPVLRELASGTKRRFQLHHAIKGVTPKVLTDTLRFLERDGVIERVLHDDGHGSKSIAYQLTELGESLARPLTALYRWGRDHLHEVHRSQAETDALWSTPDERRSTRAVGEDPESPLK
jgi:DNA-binding HxlR family transcriptional regulator